MATKVVEFRRPQHRPDPGPLSHAVTIRDRTDIPRAATVLARTISDYSMKIMVWHDITSREPMFDAAGNELNSTFFGWEADGADIWQNHGRALRAQILQACRVEAEPFWLNSEGIRSRWTNPYLDNICLADLQERCGLAAAIVIPVHMPFGQIAAGVLVSTDRYRLDLSADFALSGEMLASLTRRFLAGYVSVMRRSAYLPPNATLSSREVECLRWAACGKTDSEVSLILGISHGAVRYHITRICDKLQADNRSQAIFRAGQLGFLGSLGSSH